MSEENNKPQKKDIKVINGDVKDLNISSVYDHIKSDKPKTDNPKKEIVIPKGSSDKKK